MKNKKSIFMCAMLLYSNGITEEYKPKKLTFTEEELVNLFNEFYEIKTDRLIYVINTWCIYGSTFNPELIEYNRIASDILRTPIYSHVLYIHDSEINPKWKVTDSILYKNYNDFLIDIKKLINVVSSNIIDQFKESPEYERNNEYLPKLVLLGSTEDNRVLLGFNPDDQTEDFYKDEHFYKFSQNTYDFIINNKQTKEPFTIYADKKGVIIIETTKVKQFLTILLEKFKSKEDYEVCTNITKLMNVWTKINDKRINIEKNKSSGNKSHE